jgi:phosphohistidine phosphatase SixA
MVAAGMLGVWLAWGAVAPRALSAQPSMVVLVRHGEKATVGGSDPSLSEAGRARAQALADAVAMTTPNAIIVTSLKRTAETAAVVAAKTGVAPTVVAIDGGGAAHVAAVLTWRRGEATIGWCG